MCGSICGKMCIRDSYYTYPDDWTDSFYGVRDALSNLLTYGSNGNQVTAKDQACLLYTSRCV